MKKLHSNIEEIMTARSDDAFFLMADGWAFYDDAAIPAIHVEINGQAVPSAIVRIARSDVIAQHNAAPDALMCGFKCILRTNEKEITDIRILADGEEIHAMNAGTIKRKTITASTVYALDHVFYDEKGYGITGWCLPVKEGPVSITAEEDGREIAAKVQMFYR